MNETQKKRIAALRGVTMLPGIPEKRFVRDMAARVDAGNDAPLTAKQDTWLSDLCWKYRKQIRGQQPPEAWPEFLPPERKGQQQQREKQGETHEKEQA